MKFLIAPAIAVGVAGLIACSGSNPIQPTASTPSLGSGASSVGSALGALHDRVSVVHITNRRFEPDKLEVASGSQLTFVNDSSVDRWPRSDPHMPGGHNECPEFEAVGVLHPGQSGQTGVLTHEKCGFHDHLGGEDPIDGEVRVQGLNDND